MPSTLRALSLVVLALAGPAAAFAQTAPAGGGEPRTLRVNGVARSYFVFIPSGYRPGTPAPLVLVFHGAGGRGRRMAPHTGFSRLAEREGFIVAYPDGLGRRWNDGRGIAAEHDDVGFVRTLLDTLGRALSLDSTRVYATGISNGAMFAYRLACDLSGVFAAIAPVAGAMPSGLTERCASAKPVSVLAIQGSADPLLPYQGGLAGGRGTVLSATESVAFWSRVDGCGAAPDDAPVTDRVRDGTRVELTTYAGCRGGSSVALYTIDGGGHTWPGGPAVGRSVGRVSRELDATSEIWEFFTRHARP
jgi:polyhydroxybutyrate depolymerase